MNKDAIAAAKAVYDIESQCIQGMAEYFDEEAFSKAVNLLLKAERIGASGCGHSGIICQHFAHLMCCVEQPAKFISPAEAIHGGMGFLQKGDVILFASRGGKTGELLPILDICKAKGLCVQGHDDKSSSKCKTCRLTELLWGNCEAAPNTELTEEGSHNKIKQPQKSDQSTLLFWFALNTGTTGSSDSCRDTSCGPGYILHQGTCFRANEFVADGLCSLEVNQFETFTTQDKTTEKNCCPGQVQDSYGNCCINGKKATIYVPTESGATENMTTNSTSNPIDICLPDNYKSATTAFLFTNPDDKKAQNANYYTSGTDDQLLVCISRNDNAEIKTTDNNITCTNGRFIIYDQNNGTYKAPTPDVNMTKKINNYFSKAATGYVNGEEYTLEYTESTGWQWQSKNANTLDSAINPKHKVSYKPIQQNQQ